jgi:hypothetical protein
MDEDRVAKALLLDEIGLGVLHLLPFGKQAPLEARFLLIKRVKRDVFTTRTIQKDLLETDDSIVGYYL